MLRLLLDSHTFLWWVTDDPRLTRQQRRAISDSANACFISHASVWEMAIKASLGKLKLPQSVRRFVSEQCELHGFQLLPISLASASRVETLPFHHRDPFDRLLVAQALEAELTLVTRDKALEAYGVAVV
ncbi:MAG: type II toxin-antitoxin system VapC family toxin [Myxococcaceae bacterium]|nr:type II toxin-antitoxin system VapC family toxin [Myxococcaceae bacterium]MCI0668984.1 type II toxin-antitoxin system VapC family toxin [Myxococcaceae bacterium]